MAFQGNIQKKFDVEYAPVYYPSSEKKLKGLFRPCSTERLFVPDILSEYDSVIYLDTDIIFMAPPEQLWNEFSKFGTTHMVAMAPNLAHYGIKKTSKV